MKKLQISGIIVIVLIAIVIFAYSMIKKPDIKTGSQTAVNSPIPADLAVREHKSAQNSRTAGDDQRKYRYGVSVGRITAPNHKFRNNRQIVKYPDLSIYPVSFNSDGFRDSQWTGDYKPRIALLGDQFIEGVEVPDDQTMAQIMGAMMNMNVMNVGAMGFGTATQIVAYEDYVSKFKPSLAVLVFHFNDVYENSGEIQDILFNSVGCKNFLPCFYKEGNRIILKTNETSTPVPYYEDVVYLKSKLKPNEKNPELIYYLMIKNSVLFPPRNEMLANAWNYTEYAIKLLNEKVEANGGKLLIVLSVPECQYINVYHPSPRFRATRNMANLNYPFRRIREIAHNAGVHFYYDPTPDIDRYIKKTKLDKPYIYNRSSPQWNPLGHFLVANLTAKYILDNDLISMNNSEKDKILKKIDKNLELSPEDVFGKESFDIIYGKPLRKVPFTGDTNISRILATP